MASKSLKFTNVDRNTVVCLRARVAETFLARLVGLLSSPPLELGEGLLIRPCNSIHMFGMKFPIDAVFFDKHWQVVGLCEGIAPGQMSRMFPKARCVLELACGAIANSGTQIGDRFDVADV